VVPEESRESRNREGAPVGLLSAPLKENQKLFPGPARRGYPGVRENREASLATR
jgi:hypothetical protein